MSDDKAQTLAAQINELQEEILKSDKGNLQRAIDAGELLNLAKETVGARKWSAWREEHCPPVPQTTASLYMRLATHRAILSKQRVARMAEDGDLSLRAASKLIPKDAEKVAAAKQRKAEKDAKEAEAKHSHGEIKLLLDWCAADELFLVMQHTWEGEQIKKLAELIADHLEAMAKRGAETQAEPQTMPDIRTDQRRTIPSNVTA
jgi:hypothetical protein